MRRINYLAMALILATMVGCQKDDEFLNLQNKVEQTFYATFENGTDTRTALDASNNVVWLSGDQISVFGGTTANNSFILKEGHNTKYGTFKVNTAVAGTESNGTSVDLSANVAYYPYDGNVTVTETNGSYTFNATFPAEQTYSTDGTFGNGASPMVAVTSSILDANLKFKNAGAIFRLRLKGEATITKVVFSAETDLAGEVAITASNTSLPTVSVTNGSNAIILDCGEGVELSNTETTNFIVAMLPVETLNELTITIYDNAGKKMVSTWNNHSTIERSKAYTTEDLHYSGSQDANTVASVQEQLDNATDATTIQLEPGVDYGVLEIRAVNDNANTTMNNDYSVYHYDLLRNVENLTIKGAPGAKVDAIKVVSGYMGQIIDGKTTCYFANIKNLVIDGVEFTDNHTNDPHSYAAPIFISLTHTNVDGLTVKNCKLEGSNEKMNLVYFYGNAQTNFTTAAKGIIIEGNTVDGIARLCELRGAENITITGNIINNTYQHAILLAKDGVNYSGNVTITGNKADGINERFVRMAGAGDANVTIKDNTISNYLGEDVDYIKVTDYTNTPTIENNTCSYTVSSVDKLKSVLSQAGDNITIKLAGMNFGSVDLYNSTNNGHRYNYANYEAKNVKIVGENGTSFSKLRLGENDYQPTMTGWTFENITFTGEGLQIAMNNENVLVDNCKFNNSELMNTGTDTYQAKNFTVKECIFEGSRSDDSNRKTQMSLQNNNGVKISGCTFKNSEYSAINMTKIYGNVEISGNTINQTANRPFRFVLAANEATLSLTGNTIVSNGNNGELMKVTADSGITFAESNITMSGNTWNGKSDAEVSSGIVDAAYIVK